MKRKTKKPAPKPRAAKYKLPIRLMVIKVTDADVERWCAMTTIREQSRTFARDDLAPGNLNARKSQLLMLEIVGRLRRMMLARHYVEATIRALRDTLSKT